MQNILKSSNQNILRSKAIYTNCLHQCMTKNKVFRQCLNHYEIFRLFGSISHNVCYQCILTLVAKLIFFSFNKSYVQCIPDFRTNSKRIQSSEFDIGSQWLIQEYKNISSQSQQIFKRYIFKLKC